MDSSESRYRSATVLVAEIITKSRPGDPVLPDTQGAFFGEVGRRFRDVLEQYSGTLERAVGGNFLAHFGIDSALENTPHRAVNAVLAMKCSLEDYCRECGHDASLCLRAGIGTGPVFVGRVPSRPGEHMLSGEALDAASLLEELARPGQILACPVTRRANVDHFDFRNAGRLSLNGDDAVPVYELLSMRERPYVRPPVTERRRAGASWRAIRSPMVGRDAEMVLLKGKIQELLKGRGGIVTVSGEAGIGKSRLMAEFKDGGIMQDITLLEGRAVSMGRNLSFHPVIDLLKGWAGISEDDSEMESLAKLETAVKAVHPEEAGEIIPFVGTLMGMKLSGEYAQRVKGIEGEGLEKLIYKNIRELLLKGSELRPLVLYIEDLHWADTSSLEFIMSLFRLVKSSRLLFILVFRPGYGDTTEKLLGSIKEDFAAYHTGIELEQLSDTESTQLMDNLLSMKGFPQKLKDDILSRSDGNPFFIEEVIRSLIDRGAVEQKGETFVVTEKIHDITVPASIGEVLLSRIEVLDSETRELVRIASVIGRSFFYRIIVRVAEGIPDMDRRLAGLRDMELVREHMRIDEVEYIFKHALAHEAAYNSISENRRKDLHLRVACVIEEVFSERIHEFYGMLAWHYGKAEDMEKTEEYMLKAGEEAMKSSASSEALDCFRRSLDIYRNIHGSRADLSKVAELEKKIALSLYGIGDYVRSVEYFTRVLDYYGLRFPKNSAVALLKFIIGLLDFLIAIYIPALKWKKIPTAEETKIFNLLHKRIEALSFDDPRRMFIESFYNIRYWTKIDISRIEKGGIYLQEYGVLFLLPGISYGISKKIFTHKISQTGISPQNRNVFNLYMEFILEFWCGDWKKIEHINEEVLEISLKEGVVIAILPYLLFISWWYIESGNIQVAEKNVTRLANISDIYNNVFAQAIKDFLCIIILSRTGKYQEALEKINESMGLFERTVMQFEVDGIKAKILIMSGDIVGAKKYLKYLEPSFANKLFIPFYESDYHIANFIYHLRQMTGAIECREKICTGKLYLKAKQSGVKALRIAKKYNRISTEMLRHLGTFHWLMSQAACRGLLQFGKILPGVRARYHYRRALAWWKKSIDEGERLGARLELSRSYFEVGKRAVAAETCRGLSLLRLRIKKFIGLTPEECLDKAEAMFRDMDLQWDLEQLRELRSRQIQ